MQQPSRGTDRRPSLPPHPYFTRSRTRRYSTNPEPFSFFTSGAHREGAVTSESLRGFARRAQEYQESTQSQSPEGLEGVVEERYISTNTLTGKTSTQEKFDEENSEEPRTTELATIEEESQSPTNKSQEKMSVERRRMPQRGERMAPKFNGESDELPRFFEDMESVSEGLGLSDKEMMSWACRYVKRLSDEEVWKTTRAYVSARGTWEEFKKELFRLYPGSERDRRYTRADLQKVVDEWGSIGIKTKEDLATFNREFQGVAHFLTEKGRIARCELEIAYFSAFTGELREKMDQRLMLKDPDHDVDEPYEVGTIQECAEFILRGSGRRPVQFTSEGKGAVRTDSEEPKASDVKVVKVKEEDDSLRAQMAQLQQQMATLMAQMQEMGQRRPPREPREFREPRARACLYCGQPGHFVRECRRASQHLSDGRCKRAEWGGIVLADGSKLPRLPGKSSADCVEFMFPIERGNSPKVTTMYELRAASNSLVLEQGDSDSEVEEAEAEVAALEAMVVEAKKKVETAKRRKFDGIEIPTTARPADKGKQPVRFANSVAGPSNGNGETRRKDNGPQYRLQSPAEDQALKQSVIDKVLEAKIAMSVKEAMAVSYEVRQAVKNMTTAKRVPTGNSSANMAETYHVQAPDCRRPAYNQSQPTCQAFVPLRVIDATFAGGVTAECVLDSGSQFIAMRKDIWEKTGLSLNPDTASVVEAANSSKSHTLGAIPEVTMTIGDVDLAVHVHVVEEAPFEVLLGRPFFVLTACETKDAEDGGQVLKIRDPWQGKTALVPTRDRVRTKVGKTGF